MNDRVEVHTSHVRDKPSGFDQIFDQIFPDRYFFSPVKAVVSLSSWKNGHDGTANLGTAVCILSFDTFLSTIT